MGEAGQLERGKVLGRYVVLELLGRGGMGVVYAAYDPQLDRKIALKLLRTESAGEEGRQRMLREAQALARLAHPNVVAVHDVGVVDERVFIAMEFIDGVTLTTWLKTKRPPVREILEVFRDAGRGLAAAHVAGLVHRDFKPDNVMIDRSGRARVLDFSLVYAAGAQPQVIAPDSPVMSPLTESGVVLGTPLYMPLEVLEGASADARADQYAFCVTLYEALYGELPVVALTIEALQRELATGKSKRPPALPGVPARVRKALLRGLSPRPADRYPTLDALLRSLAIADGPPRAWLLAVIGLAALVLAGVVARELRERRALLCSGGAARVAAVWGAERRAAGAKAFTAIGRPYAAGTWKRIEALLDSYAQEWQDAFRTTCEATRIRGEQSDLVMGLRMECLDRRLDELAALGELYGHADANVVEKGVSAAISLRPVASCNEVAALAARIPPPEGEAQKKAVDALRARIARTEALVEAGAYTETRALADAIVADARRIGYRPLLGEALLLSGVIDFRATRYASAETALLEAVSAAEASRYDELAARIWPELVRLQGSEYVHLVAARASEARALAALDRVGDEGVLRARLYDAIGLLRKEEGKYAESVEQHRKALQIAEKKVGAVHPLVGELCGHLANALREAGRFDEAQAVYARALEVQEKTRGPDHPDLAEVLAGFGVTKARHGDYDAALKLNQRALEIRERALGPDHERVAVSLNNIAVVMRFQGAFAESLPLLERSRRIIAATNGEDSPEVAAVYNNIGFSLDALERYAEAKNNLERALRIRERAIGEEHPIVAGTLCNLGHVALMTHHPDVALAHYKRALQIDDKAHGSAENRAFDLVGVGRALLDARRAREALPFAEEAYALRMERAPALKLAEAEQHLARALWDAGGDRARARKLARSALERATAAGKAGEAQKAELTTWLARHE